MATKVYFIPASYIKENTIVDENVDEKYINIAIQETQDYKLKYLIGSGMFNELKTQIQNSTLTSNNTTLLDSYVIPYIVEQTLVQLMPYLLDKLSNRNLGVKDSENVSAVDFNRMEKIANEQESKAEIRAKELGAYIFANPTLYPTYFSQGTTSDTIWPKQDTFTSAIYTGNRNRNVPRVEILKYPAYYGYNCD